MAAAARQHAPYKSEQALRSPLVASRVTSHVKPSWNLRATGRPTIATPQMSVLPPLRQDTANKPPSGGLLCLCHLATTAFASVMEIGTSSSMLRVTRRPGQERRVRVWLCGSATGQCACSLSSGIFCMCGRRSRSRDSRRQCRCPRSRATDVQRSRTRCGGGGSWLDPPRDQHVSDPRNAAEPCGKPCGGREADCRRVIHDASPVAGCFVPRGGRATARRRSARLASRKPDRRR